MSAHTCHPIETFCCPSMNQRIKEGKAFICGLGNELVESHYPPGQTLHLFCLAWRSHVYKGLYLLWIGFYASLVDHEPKEFFEGHAKYALE